MRLGIITFTYGDNYGQRLQNLAVQELLKLYSDEVYTIKQLKPKVGILTSIKWLVHEYRLRKSERHKAFLRFDRQFINYYHTPISLDTADAFPQQDFDMFFAGSDQIWSPYSHDVNETMFLTFADKEKRNAISPSIASEIIPMELREKYKLYFDGFKQLSIRENKGAELIEEVSGRKATVLLDPTLMFDKSFWEKYAEKPNVRLPSKYAIYYFLGDIDNSTKIDALLRNEGIEKINIMNDKTYKNLGPSEFLYVLKNASLVVTDSYHGTIFSVLFSVPFIIVKRKSNIDMSSRFETLFSKLGIINRYLDDIDMNKVFDFDSSICEKKLVDGRTEFFDYLDVCFQKK